MYVVFLFLSFLSLQLHRHAVVAVNFVSIIKRIVSVTGGHFVMNSSLSSKYITVTKCPPLIHTNLFKRNIPLPIVDDKYSFTRARNTLALLITSIESLEPPSYWYNISNNGKGKGSLCALFRLEDCVFLSIMRTCDLIR